MLQVWLRFLICAGVIFFAGSRLSRYGDIIAEKLGLTRAWIGLVLLATITSIPELANSIGAVTYVNAPDLAIGDLFGACLFNMFTLALLDIFYKKESIFTAKYKRHLVPFAMAVFIMVLAGAGIVVTQKVFSISFFGVGIFSIAIFIAYIIGQRILFKYEKRSGLLEEEKVHEKTSFQSAFSRFFLLGLIVVAAGIYLPKVGSDIVQVTGWGGTFVGSLFLGLATTLPELVVSASALYFGLVDISIGNLVGSNIFNISIVFVADIFYRKGPILANVSMNNVFTAAAVVIMFGIATLSLIVGPKKKIIGGANILSLLMVVLFFLSFLVLFKLGIG